MAKKTEPSLKGVAAFVVIGLFLLGLLFLFPPKEEIPQQPTLPSKQVSDPNSAQKGDIASINYVLKLEDGTVVDANGEAAKQAQLKTYISGPFTFVIGKSGKVKGFDESVEGMLPGQQRTATLMPTEPVTRLTINKTKELFKTQTIPRVSFFKVDMFKELFGKPPIVNDVIWNREMPYKMQVLNFSNKTVAAKALVKEGEKLQLPGLPWKSTVISVYDRIISVRHNPETGMVIDSAFGNASIISDKSTYSINYVAAVGQLVNYSVNMELKGVVNEAGERGPVVKQLFKVTEVTNSTIVIERDDNLAEKKLTLEIKLVELKKK